LAIGVTRPVALGRHRHRDPAHLLHVAYIAISFLIGLSKGTSAGSAVSAILLNVPGDASSAATAFDGYPMAKAGKPKTAFQIGLIASVAGDILATIILIFVAIPFARVALLFGPYEMAAILTFALVFIAGLSSGNLFKGLAAGGLGIFLGTIGLDSQTGLPRMTFGYTELTNSRTACPSSPWRSARSPSRRCSFSPKSCAWSARRCR
jgi:TctA family transporter